MYEGTYGEEYQDEQYEEEDVSHSAKEYGKYMEPLVAKLSNISVSIMSIAEECGCSAYEHTGKGYIVSIVRDPALCQTN